MQFCISNKNIQTINVLMALINSTGHLFDFRTCIFLFSSHVLAVVRRNCSSTRVMSVMGVYSFREHSSCLHRTLNKVINLQKIKVQICMFIDLAILLLEKCTSHQYNLIFSSWASITHYWVTEVLTSHMVPMISSKVTEESSTWILCCYIDTQIIP